MSVRYGKCRVNLAGESSLEYTLLVCLDRIEELPAIPQSPAETSGSDNGMTAGNCNNVEERFEAALDLKPPQRAFANDGRLAIEQATESGDLARKPEANGHCQRMAPWRSEADP